MSKVILSISVCLLMTPIAFTSCKGSAGKKVATEAVEFFERKAGSKAASTIEREASQAEKTIVRETEEYSGSSRRSSRPRHHNFSDYNQPQYYTVTCSQCNGSGTVYVLDCYGNVQFDYYGNTVISQCPSCGGVGTVVVSQ